MFLISFRDCFEVSNEVEMFFEEEYEIISATGKYVSLRVGGVVKYFLNF